MLDTSVQIETRIEMSRLILQRVALHARIFYINIIYKELQNEKSNSGTLWEFAVSRWYII